ncbi:YdeI/OmpD-associated family protein [Silvibacterium sp.]|uniref:YdeI/OmpD-associated family protein n=1 Tax=Silvibacterium sp. TaxID=1964179 RepID=UPI0039E4F570
MGTRDARVDAYIAKAAPFAQPILNELRERVHEGCPEATETIKWGMPFFEYHGLLANMSAFKAHCAFGFWKGGSMMKSEGAEPSDDAMGQFGRILLEKELPPRRTFVALVKKAAKRNLDLSTGAVAKPAVKRVPKPELPVPEFLIAALKKHKKAGERFAAMPPSHRREYIEWLNEAKTEPTREKRLATAIEWIAEGKGRNWKYEKAKV